jgi:hypothetical protein
MDAVGYNAAPWPRPINSNNQPSAEESLKKIADVLASPGVCTQQTFNLAPGQLIQNTIVGKKFNGIRVWVTNGGVTFSFSSYSYHYTSCNPEQIFFPVFNIDSVLITADSSNSNGNVVGAIDFIYY